MTLRDTLAGMKAGFLTKIPPAALAVMERATADLQATGQAGRAIGVGDRAPDFTLDDQDGTPVALADLLSRGPVVLTFYRGVWCPYCNAELNALQDALPAIEAAGASLLAISPQTAVNSRRAQRENGLGFPVLADAGNAVAAAFGLAFDLPTDLRGVYDSFGINLPTFNGEDAWALPIPARYVIAPDGTVLWAAVDPDYTTRPDPAEMLPALEAARRAA